jgi:hypothetical protein
LRAGATIPRVRSLVAIALACAAAAVVAHSDAATATGLRGAVTRGPTMPVCRVDDPCEEPAARVTIVFAQNGTEIARKKTTERGTYRVQLAAGVYSVRVAPPSRLGRTITPAHVRVLAGRMRTVRFSIDTGIR